MTITITQHPANGTVSVNLDETITYTPVNGFLGFDSFRYLVTDSFNGVSNQATVEISVNGTVAQVVTQPQNGTATANPDNTITYTPDFCYAGDDSFTYRIINHPGGISNTAIVDLDVKHQDIDTWTANDDSYSVETGTTNLLELIDNDTVIIVPNPDF